MDSIFLWEWNSVGNRDIEEESERRKNLALTHHRLDVAVEQYKKETNWKPTEVKSQKSVLMDGSYVQKLHGSKRIEPPNKTAFSFNPLTSIVSIFF